MIHNARWICSQKTKYQKIKTFQTALTIDLRPPQQRVAAFTSSKEELNKADISGKKSAAFTNVSFSGKIDSKGRITIPSRIRDKLGLSSGDRINLSLKSSKVIRKEFDSQDDALQFLSGLENVESFNFDGEVLEVILNE